MKKTAYTLSILVCALLCACSSTQSIAPISDHSGRTNPEQRREIDADSTTYTVEPGDTLSQIARRSNHSVHELIEWNNISAPDAIEVGQVLRVQPMGNAASTATTSPVVSQPVTTAPVTTATVVDKPSIPRSTVFYTVESGDTLSGIARRSSHSVANLVAWNTLESADSISVGQKLRVQAPDTATVKPAVATAKKAAPEHAATAKKTEESHNSTSSNVATVNGIHWSWPTNGKIISSYTAARRGIDISGTKGQKVVAAADGTVLHRGVMTGYGNLVIVKHSNTVLSAYAHNSRITVKENQRVKRGQQIAEMGSADGRVKLHFEIRLQGKPVDPTKYLPR